MANQAIALGIRAPQGVNLGSAIQQNSALINMMVQQKAVDRQNALAAQKLEQDAALAGPAVKKATSEAQSARLKVIKDFMDTSAFGIGNSRNADDARRVGEILKSEFDDPTFRQAVDQTLASIPQDPAAFGDWRTDALMRTMEASKQLEYLVPKVSTEAIIGEGGDVGVLTRGGMGAPTIKTPRSMVPAPQRKGTVTVEDMPEAANAPIASEEAELFIASFPVEAQPAIRERVMRGDLGNVPMGSPVAAARGRGGVGGPDEGMLEMPMRASSTQGGMVSNLGPDDGYVDAPQPFRAKNPSVSPLPGSAQVPISRVRAEAVAGRETPAEAAAKARATKQVELDAEQAKKVPAKKQVTQLVTKIRNAYEELNKAEAIPSEKRGGFANAMDYMSTTSLGREAQRMLGTKYNRPLNEIVGSRKLLATAIKNATGMSAQEMNSNTELTLMLDALTDPTQGYESAISLLGTIEDLYGSPRAARPAGARRPSAAPNKPPAGVSAADWKYMTPQERALWQK